MAIITLTTDWGLSDYYTGAFKGTILKQLPDCAIVDITHNIQKFDILPASFVLKNCYKEFPQGTVHIVGVNSEADIRSGHLAVLHDGHYFIAANNGIFSLLFDQRPAQIIEIGGLHRNEYRSDSTRSIFVNAACHLAKGGNILDLGEPTTQLVESMQVRPVMEQSLIRGTVMYIDHYGNVITNIQRSLFDRFNSKLRFTIYFRRTEYNIDELNICYSEVTEGEKLAYFGDTGHLEIALNKGNASTLLGLNVGDTILVEFDDQTTG